MDAVDALRQFGTSEEQMLAMGLRREDGVRVDMSVQAVPSQVVVTGDDGGVEIDPDEESELAHEVRIQEQKDVAIIAPQPGPVPTLFKDLLKGSSGSGVDE